MRRYNKIYKAVQFSLLAGSICMPSVTYAADENATEEEVERIEVTGSRIKRTDMEGPSPIVLITEEDMKNKGFATAHDALKNLTQSTGTVQGDEFGSQGGFTPNAQTVSLRGFGPGYQLVLINGRRIAENPTPYNGQSNFVNLANIPAAAIKRIEVLTDGASAIYGSDAVAGVINIITKDDVEETSINLMGGTTKDGGGDRGRLQLVTGTSTDDFSITFTAEYNKVDPIYGKDRDWLDSVDDGPEGVDYLTRGILYYDNFEGTYRDPGESECIRSESGYEYTEREGRGYYCGYDGTGEYTIQNGRENASAFTSMKYQLTDNIEFFSDILLTKSESEIRGFRYFVSDNILASTPDGSGNYAEGTLDYVLWQRIFAPHELGAKDTDFDEQTFDITVGLNGVVADEYEWSVHATSSTYDYESNRTQLKEEKVYELFLGTGSNGFGLPDGEGSVGLYDPITSDIADELTGNQKIEADSYSRTINASLTGPIMSLDAGDVQFAAVIEFNRQGYDLTQDDRTLNQDGQGWYNLTGTEGGGDRDRFAVGGEVLIPVTDEIEVTVAGRYDKYDDDTTDVGGRFSPLIKASYRPSDEWLFRASASRSFRAPDMHYVFAEESGFYTSVYDWTQCRNDYIADNGTADGFVPSSANCDSSTIQGTRQGVKTLEEEKGENINIGFVFEPTDDLNFSLDYYHIKLEDLVNDESVSGLISDEYDCNFGIDGRDSDSEFCQRVFSKIERSTDGIDDGDITTVNINPINNALYQQTGIDASAQYNYEAEQGDLKFSVQYTHILSTKYQENELAESEQIRDKSYNDDKRSSIVGTVEWVADDYSLATSVFRTGSIPKNIQPAEYSDPDSDSYGNVDRLHPWITVNVSGTYSFTENSLARLTVTNLFDNRPPEDETETDWPFYNTFAYPGGAVGTQFLLEYNHIF